LSRDLHDIGPVERDDPAFGRRLRDLDSEQPMAGRHVEHGPRRAPRRDEAGQHLGRHGDEGAHPLGELDPDRMFGRDIRKVAGTAATHRGGDVRPAGRDLRREQE
jgi:hypothetical protein